MHFNPRFPINIRAKKWTFDNIALLDAVYGSLAEIPNSYQSLVENEEQVWQETKEFLKKQGIHFIDTLPILRELVQDGIQPYPISKDGHKNSVGHRAIAELVLSEIEVDCEQ